MPLYTNSYALVIAVSAYRNGWRPLPGVRDDLSEVRRALERQGFQVDSVVDPTRAELMQALQVFLRRRGGEEGARLVVYFAGHGYTLPTSYGGQNGYLVMADSPRPFGETKDAFKESALSLTYFEDFARQLEAKHVLFVFDACFAGSLFAARRAGTPEYISERTANPVREFLSSGSADQEVPDKSIFRRFFVDGLNGDADLTKDGYVSGTELAQFLYDRVTEDSRRTQTPQFGKLAEPNLERGDIVFVSPSRNGARVVVADADAALQEWAQVRPTRDPALYRAFIQKFPASEQAELANFLLPSLDPRGRPSQAAAPPATSAVSAVDRSSRPRVGQWTYGVMTLRGVVDRFETDTSVVEYRTFGGIRRAVFARDKRHPDVWEELHYDTQGDVVKHTTPTESKNLTYRVFAAGVKKVSRAVTYKRQSDGAFAMSSDSSWSTFEYDESGNLLFAKNSAGKGVKLSYDAQGRISSMVDQNRVRIDFKYNDRNKPIEITQVSVGSITVKYTDAGEIEKVESTAGRQVALQVTAAFQNLLDIIRPAGVSLPF